MVAGKKATPKDAKIVREGKKFWNAGGDGRVDWGVPGDFKQCERAMAEATKGKMPPEQIAGYCANRHKDATGAWPGHAPGEQARKSKGKGK